MLSDLANAVRTGSSPAADLVRRALERIERLDGQINSVVGLRSEEALAEAAAIDARAASGEDIGPLGGVPFLVKDIEDLVGMPTTHGSRLFANAAPAVRDGTAVARLRAAGAIPVGKANTPEFASDGYTGNSLWGTTRNPWAPAWSPGGSSGGSGAAVAAGMVPIATATDTGGSVRIPAAFCGLVGLKPTNDLLEKDPALWWAGFTTSGPLATTVADARLLLEVARDGGGAAVAERPPRRPTTIYLAPRFSDWGPLPAEVEALWSAAIGGIEDAFPGVPLVPLSPAEIFRTGNPDVDWFTICCPELVAWIGRERVERDMDLFHTTTREFLAQGLAMSEASYEAAKSRLPGYRAELDALLGEGGVIASPTLASTGWLAEGPLPGSDAIAPPDDVYNCSAQNCTGHPAISVPAGRSAAGVPFGLQFTGPRYAEDLLLDIAAVWEEASPWPLAAPGYEPFA